MINVTERDIQLLLYTILSKDKHSHIIPNIFMSYGESDLISVSKSGRLCEYEIKLTRKDYLADFRKNDKHLALSNLRNKDVKASVLPAYFWFVCMPDVVKVGEVPDYAGLMVVDPNYDSISVLKDAPKLHNLCVSTSELTRLTRKMMTNFWSFLKKGYF